MVLLARAGIGERSPYAGTMEFRYADTLRSFVLEEYAVERELQHRRIRWKTTK
jgi:hypothetical protein